MDAVGHRAVNAEHLLISIYSSSEELNIAIHGEKLELTPLHSENQNIYVTYHKHSNILLTSHDVPLTTMVIFALQCKNAFFLTVQMDNVVNYCCYGQRKWSCFDRFHCVCVTEASLGWGETSLWRVSWALSQPTFSSCVQDVLSPSSSQPWHHLYMPLYF